MNYRDLIKLRKPISDEDEFFHDLEKDLGEFPPYHNDLTVERLFFTCLQVDRMRQSLNQAGNKGGNQGQGCNKIHGVANSERIGQKTAHQR